MCVSLSLSLCTVIYIYIHMHMHISHFWNEGQLTAGGTWFFVSELGSVNDLMSRVDIAEGP